MDKIIYIIRHGETAYNKSGIVQGSGVDTSLNETGWAQARAFFDFYQEMNFEAVLTSGLQRSQQTVHAFSQKGILTEHFVEINEINWGVHEGKKSKPGMVAHYKNLIQEWNQGNFDARLEEGESAAELASRIQRFLDHVKQRQESKILVCTHGRTLRCMMCLVKGEDLREMESYRHRNTGLYIVEQKNESFQVLLENDAKHLEILDTH